MNASNRNGYAISPADGSPIYYRLADPADPEANVPAVLCDGIGCDGYVWKYLWPRLAVRRRVIHWHYRGHGRTPEPRQRDRVTIADLADDLACVLDDTDTNAAVLFGHSMGVQVVLETYRRHRDRVRAMVLMCGAPAHPLRTFKGRATLDRLLPAVRRTVGRTPRLFRRVSRAVLPTRLSFEIAKRFEINPELIEERDFMPYLRGLSRVDPSLFLAMLAEAGRHSALDVLPEIHVPTLIVAGARDGFTPAELSVKMAESIPDAELLMIDDGSHTAPIERPRRVNDTIDAFLRSRLGA